MNHEADHVKALAALAALNEPLRRRIYEHAVSEDRGVSRDATSAELGMSRSVAAFHLDKLVDAGLLEVDYRRPPGRRGPGAGRPAKWYRRAGGEINLSVPERRYGFAAELLAGAVERATDPTVGMGNALRDVAREHGRQIVNSARPMGGEPKLTAQCLTELLAEHGYEPRVSGSLITLSNCPFRALAEGHRDLICHLNHDLLGGVAEEAGLPADAARLDPEPGRCCVTLVA